MYGVSSPKPAALEVMPRLQQRTQQQFHRGVSRKTSAIESFTQIVSQLLAKKHTNNAVTGNVVMCSKAMQNAFYTVCRRPPVKYIVVM